eukprot:2742095-Rhodomonas_salina.2
MLCVCSLYSWSEADACGAWAQAKHAKLARVIGGQRNVTDKLRALCNSPDKEERKHAETAMRRLGD